MCFQSYNQGLISEDNNYYYWTYHEKRNKIFKYFRSPYMIVDSYKFLQNSTDSCKDKHVVTKVKQFLNNGGKQGKFVFG